MEKENPWLPMYRPKICSERTAVDKLIESVRPKNEMIFLGFPSC